MLDYAQWVKPDLLLVSYALRNTGTKSVIVAQRPGVTLSMTCLAQDGGMIFGGVGGVACVSDGDFLELKPGQALLGKEVVEVPEGCARDIAVTGDFRTLSAEAWDLLARRITYRSKPLVTYRD